jgi:CRP-like cAMP-binding protein
VLVNEARNSLDQDQLVRKLTSLIDLSDEEKKALRELPATIRSFDADQDVVRERERPTTCTVVLAGFLCRYKLLPDGKRQIMGFYIPGDLPDLQSLYLEVMDHSLGTLVPSTVALIPHESFRAIMRRHDNLAAALWRNILVDAATFRECMVGLGRRSARGRIAHLLCELLVRSRAMGLTTDRSYELPITQAELGDALGLSTVHVNRVLQELRSEKLIILRGGLLSIPDWENLKEAGEFDPTYLHLKRQVLS